MNQEVNQCVGHLQQAERLLRETALSLSRATTEAASDQRVWSIMAEQIIDFQQKALELAKCVQAHIRIVGEQTTISV